MKTAWKWIVGILLGISVMVLAVLPFFFRIGVRMMPFARGFGERGFRGFHMDGPFGMMGGGIWGGVMALRMFLLPLLVVAFLLLIGYWIGSARKQSLPAQIAASPTSQASVQTAPAPVEPVPAVEKNCKNCGKHLESEWMTCPFCGTRVE